MDIKDEKEEPYKIDKKAMVLLVSDVHMGALRTNITLFDDFLTNIISGLKVEYLKNLKALIILGDCFDIIMDNYEDFYEHKLYNVILNKFNILHEMDDFKLIFALGNHEVSVKDDYDKNFLIEKSSFLDEFKKVNNQFGDKYSFLTKNNFSQYVILKNNISLKPELFLYDTKQQIAENKGTPIELNIKTPAKKNNNILLTHGFQFDPNLDFFSKVWDFSLKVKSKIVKEIADGIWNGFFKVIYNKGRRLRDFSEKRKDRLNRKGKNLLDKTTKNYFEKYQVKISGLEKTQLDELIEKKYRADKHRDDMKDNPFNKKVETEFLPKLEDLGYKEHFNYIIYGHTHRRWPRTFFRRIKSIYQQLELFKIKNTFLFNTGAWQYVDYPSFIQIDNDWNISLVDIKTTISKVEEILEKPPSQRLERELLKRQQQIQPQQEKQESEESYLF